MTESDDTQNQKVVMVVDDERDIREIVSEILETWRFAPITAGSGEECLEKLEEGITPDLILLDVMMEGIDGWETLRRIKSEQRFANIPVSMLTVKPLTPGTMEKERVDHIENYIVKPFAMKELLSKVEEILGMEEHVREVVAELAAKELEDIAKQYEKCARTVARGAKLILALNKCASTSSVEKVENLKRILALEDRLLTINKKRLNDIEEQYGVSSFKSYEEE